MSSEGVVAISGISCRLPCSSNMDELKYNLLNGVDMVEACDKTTNSTEMIDMPRMGHIGALTKFDADFFGISYAQVNKMDPSLRILLEVTYETIVDAGVDPKTMRGTNTGVYIGTTSSPFHFALSADVDSITGYEMTGSEQCMLANRLSFWFDFQGPSVVMNTACSSSLVALDQAFKDVKQGVCTSAIVAGVNVLNHPGFSKQLNKLGMLSPSGRCASFDDKADGYCRSEGIVAIFIQKIEDAQRVYCSIIHSKVNNNGRTKEGIIYPSKEAQCRLMREVYDESGVDPSKVEYIEAHATATQAGDITEAEALGEVFCRKRSNPLKVGSVKSNIGHTEYASGLVSLAKVVIAFETKTIPKNLHNTKPNRRIQEFYDGKLEVVTENQEMEGEYIGINNFGFGGTNAHFLLKACRTAKPCSFVETSNTFTVYSSRDIHSVKEITEKVIKSDRYFQALLAKVNLMSGMAKARAYSTQMDPSVKVISKPQTKRQVWFVFSGMGSQWAGMGGAMMDIGGFKDSILHSHTVLQQFGIDLIEIIRVGSSDGSLIDTLVTITAIQIALYNVLKSMGVEPHRVIGHSNGEIVCAFADGCLTAEETLTIAYWRAYHIQNADLPHGAMAALGLSWEEANNVIPKEVIAACHNGKDSVTVSGPKHTVASLVNTLRDEGIFAKLIDTNGVAFHSDCLKDIEQPISQSVTSIMNSPKERTSRWISTTYTESLSNYETSRSFSVEYLSKNLTGPVFFYEATRFIPDNAVVIEIAPHCVLSPILKRSLPDTCCIAGLMKRGQKDLKYFLSNIGKCLEWGLDFNPQPLNGPVTFPVPRGTPMLSPIVKWDHSETWDCPTLDRCLNIDGDSGFMYTVDINSQGEYFYLRSHNINGRILFPAAGYLVLIWKSFAKMRGKSLDTQAIKFSEIEFHRAVILNEGKNETKKSLEVKILQQTGRFEITENSSLVASGFVCEPDLQILGPELNNDETHENFELDRKDVYKEFCIRGYDYGEFFQSIEASDLKGHNGLLRWSGEWVSLLDGMLQFPLLSKLKRGLYLPRRLRECVIFPEMMAAIPKYTSTPIKYVSETDTCVCQNLVIRAPLYVPVAHKSEDRTPLLESYSFIPYSFGNVSYVESQKNSAECGNIVGENVSYVENQENNTAVCENNFGGNKSPMENQDNNSAVCENVVVGKTTYFENQEKTSAVCKNIVDENVSNVENQEKKSAVCGHFVGGNVSIEEKQQIVDDEDKIDKTKTLLTETECSDEITLCIDLVVENCPNAINVLEIEDNDLIKVVKRCVSKYPHVAARYYMSNGYNIIEQVNSNDELSNAAIRKEFEKRFNMILFRGKLDTAQTRTIIEETLLDDGFVLVETREADITEDEKACHCFLNDSNITEIFAFNRQGYKTKLVRRKKNGGPFSDQKFLYTSSNNFHWVQELQALVEEIRGKPSRQNLWLISQEKNSGLLGFVNSLRQEERCNKIRCIINLSGSTIRGQYQLLNDIVQADLAVTVINEDGIVGSLRPVPIKRTSTVQTANAHLRIKKSGDLACLKWSQDEPRSVDVKEGIQRYSVCYSPLNFRDLMLATGKLSPAANPGQFSSPEMMLGMEFSGFDKQGKRVMGLVPDLKGIATSVFTREDFVWSVPDDWTLEQAATVPMAYMSAYLALVVKGNIAKGETVLIHSGSGGLGQAAITIAFSYDCQVYTTVGSDEKRDFLLSKFPKLRKENIFSSRTVDFEQNIMLATKGKGVDIVLNSLAGGFLQASVRVLNSFGRFLEMGKYDLFQNASLGMMMFLKNASFHGVHLDFLLSEGVNCKQMERLKQCFTKGIANGVVKPLRTTVFDKNNAEEAFRFMAQGKHIGKVLIKIRDENEVSIDFPDISAEPRLQFHSSKWYIITGGLGGIGLELAEWLSERGVTSLVLTSRNGVRTSYQRRKLSFLRERGVSVHISRKDVGNMNEARELVENYKPIGGIFHLATVIKDGLFQNQDEETFRYTFHVKGQGAINLDLLTRELCDLTCDWFVCFSSIASGRGNIGQTNYAYANSVTERVCENRKKDGLHGLAIQFGPIAQVGIFNEKNGSSKPTYLGAVPQTVTSCLSTLETFMNQSEPVVSCFIPERSENNKKVDKTQDIVSSVFKIIGVSEEKQVMDDSSLNELGLDSLMSIEVRHVLERHTGTPMTKSQVQTMTVKQLKELSKCK